MEQINYHGTINLLGAAKKQAVDRLVYVIGIGADPRRSSPLSHTQGKAAEAIMAVADKIKKGVAEIPELVLNGEPTFVISFRSEEVDVFHINDFMKTKGWRFNVLQLPPALHFCVTMPQTFVPDVAERLLADLRSGVKYAQTKSGTVAETTASTSPCSTVTRR